MGLIDATQGKCQVVALLQAVEPLPKLGVFHGRPLAIGFPSPAVFTPLGQPVTHPVLDVTALTKDGYARRSVDRFQSPHHSQQFESLTPYTGLFVLSFKDDSPVFVAHDESPCRRASVQTAQTSQLKMGQLRPRLVCHGRPLHFDVRCNSGDSGSVNLAKRGGFATNLWIARRGRVIERSSIGRRITQKPIKPFCRGGLQADNPWPKVSSHPSIYLIGTFSRQSPHSLFYPVSFFRVRLKAAKGAFVRQAKQSSWNKCASAVATSTVAQLASAGKRAKPTTQWRSPAASLPHG